MLICMEGLLEPAEIKELRGLYLTGELIDGAKTAGWNAREVKNNLQIMPGSEAAKHGDRILRAALGRSLTVSSALLPKRIKPPLLARYLPGMSYGAHTDNAIMRVPPGEGGPMRTDISCTVFLSEPDEYVGGELIMQEPGGEKAYKLAAGCAITYPSTTLHRVGEVTSGARDVAVTWMQSLVSDPRKREIIHDVDRTRRAIFEKEGKTDQFDTLSKTHANLVRMWASV